MLPWHNKNIQAAIRHRRYCEGLWIRTGLYVHHEMFKVSKIVVENTLASAKSENFNKRSNHPRKIKGLFSVLWIKYYIKVQLSFQILSTQIQLWPIVLINNFFCQTIINIHSGFPSSTLLHGKPLVEQSCISMMDIFEPFTETDIRQVT